jgi:hypothetical protein
MLAWHVDRFFRAGPLCALVTLVLPMAMAALVNSQRTEDNVLGILLVASGIIFIGSLIGSAIASGFGAILFSLGTAVAEVPVLLMAVVGIGLYITLVIHDLSGAFHRGPRISGVVWRNTAVTTLSIVVASTAAFTLAYFVAELTTWQSIVVPFGVAAIGFAAKLAADSQRMAGRELTAKRRSPPDTDNPVS